jgi:replicative DNA helicase
MFIYDRPMSDDAMETFGKKEMNMVIAKNRNGDSGKDIGFEFQPEYTKFTPLSPVDR